MTPQVKEAIDKITGSIEGRPANAYSDVVMAADVVAVVDSIPAASQTAISKGLRLGAQNARQFRPDGSEKPVEVHQLCGQLRELIELAGA